MWPPPCCHLDLTCWRTSATVPSPLPHTFLLPSLLSLPLTSLFLSLRGIHDRCLQEPWISPSVEPRRRKLLLTGLCRPPGQHLWPSLLLLLSTSSPPTLKLPFACLNNSHGQPKELPRSCPDLAPRWRTSPSTRSCAPRPTKSLCRSSASRHCSAPYRAEDEHVDPASLPLTSAKAQLLLSPRRPNLQHRSRGLPGLLSTDGPQPMFR